MIGLMVAPAWNVGFVCRPVSGSTHCIGHNKIAIGGENMTAISQCRGVNQHIFAGFNQAGNVKHLSGGQVIAAVVQRACQDNLAHA
ncbi:Uncharacterised protein [Yersinia aldovae]|uniref:Lipoprotein n=1 Tax=Yersinia aldovae TaxID=29483 RepID=A0ABM9SWH8_YERAL|nr:Uncharacterised protein [Yersinia aldovae]